MHQISQALGSSGNSFVHRLVAVLLSNGLGDAKVIMGTLGHKVFEPINKPMVVSDQVPNETVDDDVIELHLERTNKNVGKVEANGTQTTEGFVVLQGSSMIFIIYMLAE